MAGACGHLTSGAQRLSDLPFKRMVTMVSHVALLCLWTLLRSELDTMKI